MSCAALSASLIPPGGPVVGALAEREAVEGAGVAEVGERARPLPDLLADRRVAEAHAAARAAHRRLGDVEDDQRPRVGDRGPDPAVDEPERERPADVGREVDLVAAERLDHLVHREVGLEVGEVEADRVAVVVDLHPRPVGAPGPSSPAPSTLTSWHVAARRQPRHLRGQHVALDPDDRRQRLVVAEAQPRARARARVLAAHLHSRARLQLPRRPAGGGGEAAERSEPAQGHRRRAGVGGG